MDGLPPYFETNEDPYQDLVSSLPEFASLLQSFESVKNADQALKSATKEKDSLEQRLRESEKQIKPKYSRVKSEPLKTFTPLQKSFKKLLYLFSTSIQYKKIIAQLSKLPHVLSECQDFERALFDFRVQFKVFLDRVFVNAANLDLNDTRFRNHALSLATYLDSKRLLAETTENEDCALRASRLLQDAKGILSLVLTELCHPNLFSGHEKLYLAKAKRLTSTAQFKIECAHSFSPAVVPSYVPWVSSIADLEYPMSNSVMERSKTGLKESIKMIDNILPQLEGRAKDMSLDHQEALQNRIVAATALYQVRSDILYSLAKSENVEYLVVLDSVEEPVFTECFFQEFFLNERRILKSLNR
ncbi:UNVERIFIED_CONTAM: hypothetical protein HDU68_010866 [Siphonaria sp. JEL0065]|nr:hypothetical protein HDU68_010866 [Siphonaria sp. JEL0065]